MLRIAFRNRHRNMPKAEGTGSGPQGRINKLRRIVTDLFRYERVEDKSFYLDEARGYAELIIMEAQKHGDKHKPTMEMLDNWLLEKDMIHKLFKELAPRYEKYDKCFTRLLQLPRTYPGKGISMGVLELKGNPLPSMIPKQPQLKNNIINVLLDEIRKESEESINLKKQELFNSSRKMVPENDQQDEGTSV